MEKKILFEPYRKRSAVQTIFAIYPYFKKEISNPDILYENHGILHSLMRYAPDVRRAR